MKKYRKRLFVTGLCFSLMAAMTGTAMASDPIEVQGTQEAPADYSLDVSASAEDGILLLWIRDDSAEVDRLQITFPGGGQLILEAEDQARNEFYLEAAADLQGTKISYTPGTAVGDTVLWYDELAGTFLIPQVIDETESEGEADAREKTAERSEESGFSVEGSENPSDGDTSETSADGNADYTADTSKAFVSGNTDYAAEGEASVSDAVATEAVEMAVSDTAEADPTATDSAAADDTEAVIAGTEAQGEETASSASSKSADASKQKSSSGSRKSTGSSSETSDSSGSSNGSSSKASDSSSKKSDSDGSSSGASSGSRSSNGSSSGSRSSSGSSSGSRSSSGSSSGGSKSSGGTRSSSKGSSTKSTSEASSTDDSEGSTADTSQKITEAKSALGKYLLENGRTLVYSPDQAPEIEGMTYEATWELTKKNGVRVYLYEEGAVLEISAAETDTTAESDKAAETEAGSTSTDKAAVAEAGSTPTGTESRDSAASEEESLRFLLVQEGDQDAEGLWQQVLDLIGEE